MFGFLGFGRGEFMGGIFGVGGFVFYVGDLVLFFFIYGGEVVIVVFWIL